MSSMPVKDSPYRGFPVEAATTALIAHGWRREERQHFTAYCALLTHSGDGESFRTCGKQMDLEIRH